MTDEQRKKQTLEQAKGDTPGGDAPPDPVANLRAELVTLATTTRKPSSMAQRDGTAAAPPTSQGIDVSGEQPNMMSPSIRDRFRHDAQRAAAVSLVFAGVLSAGVAGVDAHFGVDGHLVSAASTPIVALITASVLLFVISYFTVMGFGKVALKMSIPTIGSPANTEPTKSATAAPVPTPAAPIQSVAPDA
jgi:hypothetical protein